MKHKITSSQAAVLLEVLRKIKSAQQRSPTLFAVLDIDRHDLAKCEAVINELEK